MGFSCSYERYNTAWDPNTTKAQQGKYSSKDGQRHWVSIVTFSGYNIDHTLNKIDKIEFSFKQTGGSSTTKKIIGIYPGLSKDEAVKLRNGTASYQGFTIESQNGSNIKIEVTDSTALSYFQNNFNKDEGRKTLVFFSEKDRSESVDSIGQNSSGQDYSTNYLNIENLEINVYSSPKNEEATVTDVTLGEANTVTVVNPISGHYYQVVWRLGDNTYTYPSNSLTGITPIKPSFTFSDWGSLFPNANSMTGTITLKVYSASSISQNNFLGERTYSVLFKVPDYIPSFNSSSFALESSYYNSSNAVVYLDGLSKVNVSCGGSTSYGASISSITVTYGDSSYSYLTNTLTDLIIPLTTKNSGKYINITIKDSRGKIATISSPAYTVINTYLPTLENYNVERCDSSGNLNSSGTYIKLSGTLSNATLAGGSASILDEESTSSVITWNGSIGKVDVDGGFNTDSQYKIIINIQSNTYYLNKNKQNPMTRSYTDELPSAAFLLHFLKGGKSIGIGCAAEEPGNDGLITMGWPTTFKNDTIFNIESSQIGTNTTNRLFLSKKGYNQYLSLYTYYDPNKTSASANSLIFNNYMGQVILKFPMDDQGYGEDPRYLLYDTNIDIIGDLDRQTSYHSFILDGIINHLSENECKETSLSWSYKDGQSENSKPIYCYVHCISFTATGAWNTDETLQQKEIASGSQIISIGGGFYTEDGLFTPANTNGMGEFRTGAYVSESGILYYYYPQSNKSITARLIIYYTK